MAEPSWPSEVELSAHLADLAAVQQKFRLPPPVIVLCADLLKRVPRRVAVRNASELLGALLVGVAKADAETLGKLVGDFRETEAHAILDTTRRKDAFPLPARNDLNLS